MKIFLLVIATLVGLLFIAATRRDPAFDLQYDVTQTCQDAVLQRLKAPGTATFQDTLHQNARHITGGVEVDAWVDSENSFGAKLRLTYTCILAPAGVDKWRVSSLDLR